MVYSVRRLKGKPTKAGNHREEGTSTPDSEAKKKWIKDHTTKVTIKLNHNTDKDLLDALEGEESKAGKIKELMRRSLEAAKHQE